MTQLLIRLFVRHPDDTKNAAVRTAYGNLASLVGMACNLLLCLGKLAAGTLFGSIAIMADALNNLSDASSNVVSLVGFRLAAKGPDEKHPYGHARFEYLSGLVVSAMIVIIGFELAKTSVGKILSPVPVVFSAPLAAVLVLSIAVKLWLCLFNRTLGRKINSTTLLATSEDSRNDIITTAAVLLAAVIEAVSGLSIDGFVGLAVSLFILYSGAKLAKETISPLLGEAASPELQSRIVDYISAQPKVLGYHDLMVHDYGPGQRFATIHVEMDCKEDPMQCHELIDDMERECLKSHNIHLVIHYDPVVTDDPELTRLHILVDDLLSGMDARLKTHDFRMVPGGGHTNLIFDIAVPQDTKFTKSEIQDKLEEALRAREGKTYHTIITFDPLAFNQESCEHQ